MLALLRRSPDQLFCLQFGDVVDPARTPEEHVRWVLADYAARRDLLWDIAPVTGQAILSEMLPKVASNKARLLDVLDALHFYAVPDPAALRVVPFLRHAALEVRLAAIRALGAMAKYTTAADLLPFLSSANAQEREAAAWALAKFGKEDLIAELRAAAARDPALEIEVLRAEERAYAVQEQELSWLVEPLLQTEDYEELCVFSPFCATRISRFVADERVATVERVRAARVVGLTRQRKLAGPALLRVAQADDTPEELRLTAIWALGRMQLVSALTGFMAALPGARGELELRLIEAMGRIAKPRALGVLLNHYEARPDPAVREALRLALTRVARPVTYTEPTWDAPPNEHHWLYVITDDQRLLSEHAEAALVPALAAPDSAVRMDAVFALGVHGDLEQHSPALRELVDRDPNPSVRRAAALALRRLAAHS